MSMHAYRAIVFQNTLYINYLIKCRNWRCGKCTTPRMVLERSSKYTAEAIKTGRLKSAASWNIPTVAILLGEQNSWMFTGFLLYTHYNFMTNNNLDTARDIVSIYKINEYLRDDVTTYK